MNQWLDSFLFSFFKLKMSDWRLVLRRLLIGFVALAVLIVLLCVATLCFGANAVLQF